MTNTMHELNMKRKFENFSNKLEERNLDLLHIYKKGVSFNYC